MLLSWLSMMTTLYAYSNLYKWKEDLTPENTRSVIDAIKRGEKPKVGPYNGRMNCEPIGGPTTLLEEPKGPGFGVRADL